MNRRDVLKLGMCVPVLGTSLTYADCRDERRIPQPHDPAVEKCLELYVRTDVSGERSVARAVFTFGLYEELLRYKERGKTYRFLYDGKAHTIRVTSVSVDVDVRIGCVVCVVQGQIWSSG